MSYKLYMSSSVRQNPGCLHSAATNHTARGTGSNLEMSKATKAWLMHLIVHKSNRLPRKKNEQSDILSGITCPNRRQHLHNWRKKKKKKANKVAQLTLWVNLQFSFKQEPFKNFVQTATLSGSWMYGHFPSPLLHFPNLVKNWQYCLFLAKRDLTVCKLHLTFSLASIRVNLFGSLTSLLPFPIRIYLFEWKNKYGLFC